MQGAGRVKVFDMFKTCNRTGDYHSFKKRNAK